MFAQMPRKKETGNRIVKLRTFSSFLLTASAITTPVFAADMPVKARGAQAPTSAWTSSAEVEFRYFSWERTAGNPTGQPNQKGTQVYVPIGLSAAGQFANGYKVELNARSGYVGTNRSADPGTGVYTSGSVSTTTDTTLGMTLTYLNINGFVPFYSLNLNLPTGQSALSGTQPLARTDPDLVDVPSFGVGFNHAHTLGANIPLSQDTVLTLSGAYTNRGAYTRDLVGPPPVAGYESFKPGDNYSLSAGIGTQVGKLSLNVTGAVSWDLASKQNDVETSKTGTNVLVSGVAAYAWNDAHTSTFLASYTHTNRNYLPTATPGVLLLEPFNSNNNIFTTSLEHAITVAPQAQVFGKAGYLYRDANSYDPTTAAFISAKEKFSVGGGVRYSATQSLALNGKVEKFWIDERAFPGVPTPAQKFEGFVVGVGATAKF
jgi:hypothetical protein